MQEHTAGELTQTATAAAAAFSVAPEYNRLQEHTARELTQTDDAAAAAVHSL
jgi:hypothetical protein